VAVDDLTDEFFFSVEDIIVLYFSCELNTCICNPVYCASSQKTIFEY